MKNLQKEKLKDFAKSIVNADEDMCRMASSVWGCLWENDIGGKICDLDMYKLSYFGDDVLKKHNITCVYGLPNYEEICDKIYKKFKPVFKDVLALMEGRKETHYIHTLAEIGAYFYYHYAGWIERFYKEKDVI